LNGGAVTDVEASPALRYQKSLILTTYG